MINEANEITLVSGKSTFLLQEEIFYPELGLKKEKSHNE